jgi:hypothetical protein
MTVRFEAASERAGSTTKDVPVDRRRVTPGLRTRRAFVALLALVILAGLLGLFGVHSRSVAARGRDGEVLAVHYASIARAGLSTPFQITVHDPGGFDGPVVLAVSRDYLDLFDVNSVNPQPDSERGNPDNVVWRFDTPHNSTFVVSVDLEVQSSRHFGQSGYVVLERESGRHIARAEFRTNLAP